MSGIFFYLSSNFEAYVRLTAEIRNTFSCGQDICQGPQLNSCKYLRAVIDETMRMSPSTLAVAWREQDPVSIAAGESFVVDGHIIPPGTQVALSNYALQHNPSYFSESHKFYPERWLTPEDGTPEIFNQQDARANMRRAFAPFSVGDRSCAGKSMAYLEMSLTVARTLWYFDFKKPLNETNKLGEGTPRCSDKRERSDEFQLYEGVVVGHNGPNLVFTTREEYWKELKTTGS
jgi:cytochrome P450